MQSIQIDLSRDSLFDAPGLRRLKDSYMLPTESSPQERFAFVARAFQSNPEHGQRMYDYVSRHWVSFSTPILSYGRAKHGLPISCYLVCLPDTSEGLLDTLRVVNRLSMLGGGVGVSVNLRPADSRSSGVMPHMKTYDSCALAYQQDEIRRGSSAMFLRIDHPEIHSFIDMRKTTGDPNIRCHNLHHAVVITDEFMNLIERCLQSLDVNDSWPLIDPHTKRVVRVVSAKELWEKLLDVRKKTGEPYLCFIDTCNRDMYPFQKERGRVFQQSNLCSEIVLFTDPDNIAVCCLSSLNLSKYDDWKHNQTFIDDFTEFLDNALEVFISRAPADIAKARATAINERSIGIGAMGFHDYLQQRAVDIESAKAREVNIDVFSNIRRMVDAANYRLGAQRGVPNELVGTGRRFCCTMAIAPTASTSIIMGNTSPSIEPYRANAYRQDTLSGTHLSKNRNLDAILRARFDSDTVERIWHNILMNSGSVSHLPDSILTPTERSLFKTAFEIDQMCLVRLAADRQRYIDQAQSLNLFLLPTVDVAQLHRLHYMAWKLGLKTLYYLRSTKTVETDKLGEQSLLPVPMACRRGDGECLACQ